MSYIKEEWLQREQARAELLDEEEPVPTAAEIMAKVFYGPHSAIPTPEFWRPVITEKMLKGAETDKPEGTRDVEKFLKEQQDALWRDD